MKIVATRNGSTIHGDCAMIQKYGEVFPCIDNKYHPNTGEAYSEIERVVDWLFEYDPIPELTDWVNFRVAEEYFDPVAEDNYSDDDLKDEILLDVMYCDIYQPCQATVDAVNTAVDACKNPATRRKFAAQDIDEIQEKIADHLNENYLRVRAGGKLNPEGTDSIYFRISSHGYAWNDEIEDFLWNTFENVNLMPQYIWIGHDGETNPPEITLYEGTPEDLLGVADNKVYASHLSDFRFN